MSDVTRMLIAIDQGDQQASAELLPLVYQELRKLAAAKLSKEQPGQTLQPTMLVHEAYIRLVDVEQPQQWNGRAHFFGAAAEAMRRIVIEKARHKRTQKPEVIQRFIEEAQIGGQLQHPGIAPIYELGQFKDKRPFFAMKLVKGETLSKLLADRKDAATDRGRADS